MEMKSDKPTPQKPVKNRGDRLKAALKANLQRRKSQVKARKQTEQDKG